MFGHNIVVYIPQNIPPIRINNLLVNVQPSLVFKAIGSSVALPFTIFIA